MKKEWKWELINEHESLTEGPLWIGKGLIYNECYKNITYFWDPKTLKTSIWRENTGGANGMAFDRSGEIYVCEGENHRLVNININNPNCGPKLITANQSIDKLNMPNDLAINSNGQIYFSDPNYSNKPNFRENESVYLIENSFGGFYQVSQVTFDTKKPNGVLLSVDQKKLFVAESPVDIDFSRQLRSYPIKNNGTLDDYKVLHDFGPYRGIDGMTLTSEGNILATAGSNNSGPGSMIYELNESGRVITTHPCPSNEPTNCSFGGVNNDILFITFATGKVYQVKNSNHIGQISYPTTS